MSDTGSDAGVREYLAVAIAAGVRRPAAGAHTRYRIPKPSVSRILRQLADEGIVKPEGRTKARHYEIALQTDEVWTVPIGAGSAEHELWDEWISPRIEGCNENIRDICHYGFTEMVNNVIDHSESEILTVRYEQSLATIRLSVLDGGIGIFRKLQRDLGLGKRDAIFELCKGKLTTDPARHTGEGLFFTSRMFDMFFLASEELCLGRYWGGSDILLEDVGDDVQGTTARMTIGLGSKREMKAVFDVYAGKEDFGFSKTHILVNLARTGREQLVSRSQARRLLVRFEQFREITLDFTGVDLIGPAFADEIFRVFKAENPGYRVTWIKANAAVERMIRKALSEQK